MKILNFKNFILNEATSQIYDEISGVNSISDNGYELEAEKFDNENDLKSSFIYFLNNISNFNSREYILENLTLEICAEKIISKLYE